MSVVLHDQTRSSVVLAQRVLAECRGAFAGVGGAEQWHVEPVVALAWLLNLGGSQWRAVES